MGVDGINLLITMVINNLGTYLILLFEEKIFHFQSDLKFSQVFLKTHLEQREQIGPVIKDC